LRYGARALLDPFGGLLAVELMLDTMLRVSEAVNADMSDVVGSSSARFSSARGRRQPAGVSNEPRVFFYGSSRLVQNEANRLYCAPWLA
jgi:hypothetical protein